MPLKTENQIFAERYAGHEVRISGSPEGRQRGRIVGYQYDNMVIVEMRHLVPMDVDARAEYVDRLQVRFLVDPEREVWGMRPDEIDVVYAPVVKAPAGRTMPGKKIRSGCPICGAPSVTLMLRVDCSNSSCQNFSAR